MEVPSGIATTRDLVYAEVEGFRPLSLDLHRPAAEGAPLIVFVHGGGWRRGSRAVMVPTLTEPNPFARITDAGFAVASIDYRLSGEAVYPAQVDDVRAAVSWLRANGTAYGVDARRPVLWGESAGATLAALVALEPESGVAGLIDWYGPADLQALSTELGQLDDPTTREAGWLGGAVGSDPERARAASPITRVRPASPPTLIAHGTADVAVPPSQSEAFAAALRAAGVEVELHLVPGGEHMWHGDVDRLALLDQAIAWARARVAPTRPSSTEPSPKESR